MKKLLILLLLITLTLFTPLFGQGSTDITQRPTSYWFSGNPDRDNAWNWMKEANNNIFGNIGTGKTFYVDSGVNIEGRGLTMDSAFNTLQEGIDVCVANRGDRIYIAQGYTQAGVLGTAAMCTVDCDGIQIIGLGQGSLTATFIHNFTSNTFVVTANNVDIHNLRLRPSISAVTVGMNVTGSYVNVNNCDFGYPETSTDEFAIALYVGTSTGVVVENNYFNAGAQAAVTGITFDEATGLIIRNNTMFGDCATAVINNALETSEYVLIEDNILWNGDTAALNGQPVIEVLASTVGISRRNYTACNVTAATAYVGTLLFNFDNFYTEEQGGAKTAMALAGIIGATTTHSVLLTTDD